LNARLVCKACHTVFHLDNTGRMVLGEPESFDMKTNKSRADEVSSLADFDLAQTWNDIPAAIKYGIPGVLLAAIFYLNFGSLFSSGKAEHESRAEAIIQAVTSNNRGKLIGYATPDSAESAGQFFDLIHGEVEKNQFGSNTTVSPQLFSGVPEKDSDITMLVVVSKNGGTEPPMTFTIPLKRETVGSPWLLEGNAALLMAQGSGSKKK
jgi:hypothetical protein